MIQRLPASELNKVRPEDIFAAVEMLLEGFKDHPFAPSTDYDFLTDGGHRLPPKAVFGIAATRALRIGVGPYHFTAGVGSACFRILEDAGYRIVPKNEQPHEAAFPDLEDDSWAEGNTTLVTHKKRERSPAAARAKKSEFKAIHGKLFCEKCGFVPTEHYNTAYAESCIEIHHRDVQVQDIQPKHRTKLDMLQCLCANCHRLEHRLLREAIA